MNSVLSFGTLASWTGSVWSLSNFHFFFKPKLCRGRLDLSNFAILDSASRLGQSSCICGICVQNCEVLRVRSDINKRYRWLDLESFWYCKVSEYPVRSQELQGSRVGLEQNNCSTSAVRALSHFALAQSIFGKLKTTFGYEKVGKVSLFFVDIEIKSVGLVLSRHISNFTFQGHKVQYLTGR